VLISGLFPVAQCMCPQGFGGGTSFPEEWKIPKWPVDMSLEDAAKLRTVTLGGFTTTPLNEEYLEGPTKDFDMQGRETYWQSSGEYFMFYCTRFRKWRIAALSAFGNNMQGNCFAFVSDGYPDRDIQNKSYIKGWIEVEDGEWKVREHAGVVEVGFLGDQMGLEVDEACDEDTADGEAPFGETKKSNCPVMPVVRKARDKVVQGAKAAGNWVRRLFPKVLGAPDEEDAIPEEDESDTSSSINSSDEPVDLGSCDPVTQKGCSYKQKFFIEKQAKTTKEQREQELERLVAMKDVVMKPDQVSWVKIRVAMLKAMVVNDNGQGVPVEERKVEL